MKTLLLSVCILFLVSFSVRAQEEPRIVDCALDKSISFVKCDRPHSKKKVVFSLDGLDLKEWRLKAPKQGESVNSDAPLFEEDLIEGQIVKAIITNNQVTPVSSCAVRVWLKLKDYTSNHPGERVPFSVRTEPDDCQPWYTEKP